MHSHVLCVFVGIKYQYKNNIKCNHISYLSIGKFGPAGAEGAQGPPGQKGERGATVEGPAASLPPRQTSAFFVSKTSDQNGDVGDILLFDRKRANIGNEDFDVSSGIFTCRIRGLYSFNFNINFLNSGLVIQLTKDGEKICSVYKELQSGIRDILSNTAILQLEEGDRVWLEFQFNAGTVHSNGWLYTTFSGFLLQEL